MGVVNKITCSLVLGGLLCAAGCSTTKKTAQQPIFYPPLPAQPKLQYLTSFSMSSDLVPRASGFSRFLLGEDTSKYTAIMKPYGLEVRDSKLYVCDTIVAQMHILDFTALTWETFVPKNRGKLDKCINVAVDSANNRYVADPGRGEVLIYSPDGKFVEALRGEKGMKPVGLAVSDDRIFVGDLKSRMVNVFDKNSRELLFSIPRDSENEQEKLFAPTNLALNEQGNIYVSDTGGFRVQEYDPDGNYIRTYGSQGDSPGQFARNKGVAVDREGIVYVVDAASQTVQVFDAEGNLLLYFGEPGGSAASFVLPADIVIDYGNVAFFQSYVDPNFKLEYLIFVSNQYGPRKVAVYGFGAMMSP